MGKEVLFLQGTAFPYGRLLGRVLLALWPGPRNSGENMGADIHDGFERSMKVIEGDTEMIGVGMEFFKGNPLESLEAPQRVLNVGNPGPQNLFV